MPRPKLEYTLAKPNTTHRIMILGPSFAYGWEISTNKVLQTSSSSCFRNAASRVKKKLRSSMQGSLQCLRARSSLGLSRSARATCPIS